MQSCQTLIMLNSSMNAVVAWSVNIRRFNKDPGNIFRIRIQVDKKMIR